MSSVYHPLCLLKDYKNHTDIQKLYLIDDNYHREKEKEIKLKHLNLWIEFIKDLSKDFEFTPTERAKFFFSVQFSGVVIDMYFRDRNIKMCSSDTTEKFACVISNSGDIDKGTSFLPEFNQDFKTIEELKNYFVSFFTDGQHFLENL